MWRQLQFCGEVMFMRYAKDVFLTALVFLIPGCATRGDIDALRHEVSETSLRVNQSEAAASEASEQLVGAVRSLNSDIAALAGELKAIWARQSIGEDEAREFRVALETNAKELAEVARVADSHLSKVGLHERVDSTSIDSRLSEIHSRVDATAGALNELRGATARLDDLERLVRDGQLPRSDPTPVVAPERLRVVPPNRSWSAGAPGDLRIELIDRLGRIIPASSPIALSVSMILGGESISLSSASIPEGESGTTTSVTIEDEGIFEVWVDSPSLKGDGAFVRVDRSPQTSWLRDLERLLPLPAAAHAQTAPRVLLKALGPPKSPGDVTKVQVLLDGGDAPAGGVIVTLLVVGDIVPSRKLEIKEGDCCAATEVSSDSRQIIEVRFSYSVPALAVQGDRELRLSFEGGTRLSIVGLPENAELGDRLPFSVQLLGSDAKPVTTATNLEVRLNGTAALVRDSSVVISSGGFAASAHLIPWKDGYATVEARSHGMDAVKQKISVVFPRVTLVLVVLSGMLGGGLSLLARNASPSAPETIVRVLLGLFAGFVTYWFVAFGVSALDFDNAQVIVKNPLGIIPLGIIGGFGGELTISNALRLLGLGSGPQQQG